MFYHFLLPWHDTFSFLRIFQYITFRSAYAALTGLLIAFFITPLLIRWLTRIKLGEKIREDGPASHHDKAGTPTMGGMIILLSMTISIILWGNFSNYYVIVLIAATLLFGILGFVDDYRKAVLHIPKGLSPRMKLLFQFLIAFFVCIVIFYFPSNPEISAKLYIPFGNEPLLDFKNVIMPFFTERALDLTWLYLAFAIIIIMGTSNAVNLTDGLDGLAIGNSLIVVATFTLLVYVSGHIKIAKYLIIPFTPHAGELTVILSAFIGAGLGFLWFNANPAELFMGDTGSLAIGGMIGTVAIMIKKEFLLSIIGGVFVLELMSVVIQVASYKMRGKRVFKMAPLHHHFELSGWKESKVVTRFWIIGFILALFALSSLKIR
jgi:phospho-N-acetylmuramoyl-pentapeptide-transferase